VNAHHYDNAMSRDADRSRVFMAAMTRLATAAGLCRPGEILAVEFRTLRDVAQAKVTGAHFRRFIDQVSPAELIRNLSRAQRQDNPDGDDSAPDPDAAGSGNS
jgi:hypothetical protein